MRISERERALIKQTCLEVFGTDEVYLFGSRVDDTALGGDIDLFIETDPAESPSQRFEKKIRFLTLLKMRIGDQKIDVVLAQDSNRPIEQEARKTGIKL